MVTEMCLLYIYIYRVIITFQNITTELVVVGICDMCTKTNLHGAAYY